MAQACHAAGISRVRSEDGKGVDVLPRPARLSISRKIRSIVFVPVDVVKSPEKTSERNPSFSTNLLDGFITVTPELDLKAIKHPAGTGYGSQQLTECRVWIDLHYA